MDNKLLLAYHGLRRVYLKVGATPDKAHDLAIAAMAHHEPTVALAREVLAR